MTVILSVKELEKTFGAVVAAHAITCDLLEGEVVGVIGANGAGKTTFVNMITGHLMPTSGRIVFEDRDIAGVPSRMLVPLGITRSFQIAQIFPSLTTLENVCAAVAVTHCGGKLMGSIFNRMKAPQIISEAQELLEAFLIHEHRDDLAGTLSQGVRKILDIAMACASKPRLLLLDEPTSGVSLDERHSLMAHAVNALKKRNTTVVFVEHDMEVVRDFADRVLAFYEGRVIADGRPEDILSRADVRQLIIGSKKQVSGA